MLHICYYPGHVFIDHRPWVLFPGAEVGHVETWKGVCLFVCFGPLAIHQLLGVVVWKTCSAPKSQTFEYFVPSWWLGRIRRYELSLSLVRSQRNLSIWSVLSLLRVCGRDELLVAVLAPCCLPLYHHGLSPQMNPFSYKLPWLWGFITAREK